MFLLAEFLQRRCNFVLDPHSWVPWHGIILVLLAYCSLFRATMALPCLLVGLRWYFLCGSHGQHSAVEGLRWIWEVLSSVELCQLSSLRVSTVCWSGPRASASVVVMIFSCWILLRATAKDMPSARTSSSMGDKSLELRLTTNLLWSSVFREPKSWDWRQENVPIWLSLVTWCTHWAASLLPPSFWLVFLLNGCNNFSYSSAFHYVVSICPVHFLAHFKYSIQLARWLEVPL